jgi:putative methionine-R-sulfoxide reductase with GAF domain
MDYYSILDNNPSQAGPEAAAPELVHSTPVHSVQLASDLASSDVLPSNLTHSKTDARAKAVSVVRESLRFPGEDGGKSLSEMAQHDLDATLQLLAERAQYITGASGAAVALRQGESMVCCASAGASAPELGAHLQIDSGLSAESVRTRKILICEDAENDPRVNRESCRTFGIASVVVMPLVRGEEVYGVFELLSGRPRAFEERDFVALNRLAEMIQTAVEHADAARRAERELGQPEITPPATSEIVASPHSETVLAETKDANPVAIVLGELQDVVSGPSMSAAPGVDTEAIYADLRQLDHAQPNHGQPVHVQQVNDQADHDESDAPRSISGIEFGNLRRCETCGFPVSAGRKLCLDCEAASPGATANAPEFFGDLGEAEPSWVKSHGYLLATALVAAATIALLIWRL